MPDFVLDYLKAIGKLDPFIGPFAAVLLLQMVVIRLTKDKATRTWAMRGSFMLDAIIIMVWLYTQLKDV